MIDLLIEFSHKLISKSTPGSQGRKTPFERKERTTYSPSKRKRKWYKKILRKKRHLQKKKEKHMWLSGRLHIEGPLNEGPRLQRKHKDGNEAKRKNVTPKKDVMTSANQTPRGHKFAPLVASQQGRANQHEPACFGLSSSWSFPSRSGIPLHAVVQPCFFLRRSILP